MSKLQNFDTLPDAAHVTDVVVAGILDCDRSSVWRKARAGKIPKPVKLSERCTRWRVGDIRAWLSQLHGEGAA